MIAIQEVLEGGVGSALGLRPGDRLLSVDGEPVDDFLDWNFLTAEPAFRLEVLRGGAVPRREVLEVVRELDDELGVVLEPPAVKRCTNKCDFCFIDQMPKGLRRSLYVKDEDYRYSFLYGNFVTLTNLKERDFERILRYRLTPLYVSVHATEPALRERILKNPRAGDLLPQLARLAAGGIAFHAQVVLSPGVNDGSALRRTIDDLLAFGEALLSISVVPVGLTGHRERLPDLIPVSAEIAAAVVGDVEDLRSSLAAGDRAKVLLADEFWLRSGAELPPAEAYGDFGLVENGVGMTRLFLEEVRQGLPELAAGGGARVLLLTGAMMAPLLEAHVAPELARRGWAPRVLAVENRLFGAAVTCAGLLPGRDLLEAARAHAADLVLYPREALNIDGRFLDDVPAEQLEAALEPVVLASRTILEELGEFRARVAA